MARRSDPQRVLLLAVWVALCATVVVAAVALVAGELNHTGARVVASSAAMFVYSLTGLAGATLMSKRRDSVLGGATLAASAVGLPLTLIMIWVSAGGGDTETLQRAAFSVLAVALAGAQASLLQERRRDSEGAVVATVTTAAQVTIAIVAAMIVFPLVYDETLGDAYWRFMGVVAVLHVAAVLLVPLLRGVGRGPR